MPRLRRGRRLVRLRQLSLQSNRLTSMLGLGACTALEELYLSHNGITCIEVGLPPGHTFWCASASLSLRESAHGAPAYLLCKSLSWPHVLGNRVQPSLRPVCGVMSLTL